MAAQGDEKESARLIVEMKEQHEEQVTTEINRIWIRSLGKTDQKTGTDCGRSQ